MPTHQIIIVYFFNSTSTIINVRDDCNNGDGPIGIDCVIRIVRNYEISF